MVYIIFSLAVTPSRAGRPIAALIHMNIKIYPGSPGPVTQATGSSKIKYYIDIYFLI